MAYKRWVGPSSGGTWSTSSSWSPSGVPTSADEAVFESTVSLSLGSSTRNCLHLVNVNNTTLTLGSMTTVNVYGNFTNNGTVTVSSGTNPTFNFALSSVAAYIYSANPIFNANFTFTKDTYTIYLDSDITLYRSTSTSWSTGTNGVLNFNTGSWQMNGRNFTCNRITMNTSTTRQWWMNGNLTLRGSTGTPTLYTLASCTLNETTGRFIVYTSSLTGAVGHSNSLNSDYATAFNWTIKADSNAVTYTPIGHYKNFIADNITMSAASNWRIHDSFTTQNGALLATGTSALSFYTNNGNNAIYNSSFAWTTINFERWSGSGGTITINQSQATTNNLYATNLTYYVNHSSGTGKTFNCGSVGSSTYYIKITGTASGTFNCNGTNDTFYFGWAGNAFSQTCGAYILNCGTTVGSGSNFYYDNCTDNASSPCTITIGAASGSTTIGGGTHYIGDGLNITGTLNFNGGTLSLISAETPVVGTFNSCSSTSHDTNARTFNWNGRYIRVNNQARTANTNGTGSVLIRNSTTTTSTSDMTSSITSNGGIQMESTGNFAVGNWTDTSCPRIKLVALGTAASTRTFGSTASHFRSIDIYGPVSISSTNMTSTLIQFKGYNTGVTWDGVGSAANFNALNCYLGNLVDTDFTYNNSNALTDTTKRINTVAALEGVGSPPGNNTVYNIIAYSRSVDLTKVNGTYNLNDVNVQGYVRCQPYQTGVDGVTYNWNKVIKLATTSAFSGYAGTIDSFRAYSTDDGRYTTHNFPAGVGTTVDVKGNRLVFGNPTSGTHNSTSYINTSIAAEVIELGNWAVVRVASNVVLKNIYLAGSTASPPSLQATSDFTITGTLLGTTNGDISFSDKTITFTGEFTDTPLSNNFTGTVDAASSNLIFRNVGNWSSVYANIGGNRTYGTITNGCSFTHSSNGGGTGRLIINTGTVVTGTTQIGTVQSEDNSVSRGFGKSGSSSVNITNPNFSGTSTNRNYVTGNWVKNGGGSVNLSWLGIVSSTVSGASGNWVAEDSINYGSNSGWTILATATYSITPANNTMDEGANVTINVSTTGIPNATTLYWTIAHGTTASADFTATSGSFTINSDAGSFTITTIADQATEGNQTFAVELRTGSTSGTVKATSDFITIIDTSVAPSYSVSEAANNVNEGNSVAINVTTTGISNGTTLYWTIVNTTTSNQDFSAASGSFTINSNSGSFNVTASADYITEGSETFQVQIRTGSTSGTIVATTGSITINDTTIYPVYIGFLQFF